MPRCGAIIGAYRLKEEAGPRLKPGVTGKSAASSTASGDDVGDDLVDQLGNLVAQQQFALLQPGGEKLVMAGLGGQCLDRSVEVAMLHLELRDPAFNLLRLVQDDAPARWVKIRPIGALLNCRASAAVTRSLSQSRETFGKNYDVLSPPVVRREMRMNAHVSALELRHADLDQQIAEELRRPAPDTILMARLKKEKLKVKEMILSS